MEVFGSCVSFLNFIIMNTQDILKANILDILFDGRNKAYGAYDLRKNYNKRLVKALGATLSICLLFTIGSIFANSKKVNSTLIVSPIIDLSSFTNKKPNEVEPAKAQPKPQSQKRYEQVAVTIPVIVPNSEVTEQNEVKPVDVIEDIKIGASNFDGEKGGDNVVDAAPFENSVTGTSGNVTPKDEDINHIFTTVEIAAQFPGGFDAWKKYLERNLNAGLPAENGAQTGKYTVMVSFVVDAEGNISDVKAENAPGFGTEAEAIKIIKKGPRWLPAIQNGKKVAYRARQQVTFLVDDNG
jgi:periplasmic protein TonB